MYKRELARLSRAGVKYLVIGGVALGLSGYPRATLDLDLFVELSEENLNRLLKVLGRMGYEPKIPVNPEELKDPEKRKEWVRTKHAKVFTFHQPQKPYCQIDILLESPISFAGAWTRSRIVFIGGQKVHVACPEDLLHLKQLAGRKKDKEDIEIPKEIIQVEMEEDDEIIDYIERWRKVPAERILECMGQMREFLLTYMTKEGRKVLRVLSS